MNIQYELFSQMMSLFSQIEEEGMSQFYDNKKMIPFMLTKINSSRKALLSTLWIFVLMNMIYADIIGMLKPGYLEFLEQMSQELSPQMVLLFSVLMEVPIIMILLSKILSRHANRITQFIAVPLSILWVWYGMLLGTTPLSYMFFAGVETATMLYIGWFAWKWPESYEKEHGSARLAT